MRNKSDPCLCGKQIILKHLDKFLAERTLVLFSAEEIEPVHRMRVASRRLRAALKAFKGLLPGKKAKVWTAELSRIGSVLGRARQIDVQIKFLNGYLKNAKNRPRSAYLAAVIQALKKKRKLVQRKILIVFKIFEANQEFAELRNFLCKPKLCVSGSFAHTFDQLRAVLLAKQLDRLLEFAVYVDKPKRVKELHQLRIAAKKLRYTLEIYRLWHGARFDKYILASRMLQDLLGDVHELDCLKQDLAELVLEEVSNFKAQAADVVREVRGLRRQVYQKFNSLWKKFKQQRLWEDLYKKF